MVTAEERKHELDGIVRAMGVWYMVTPDKSPGLVIDSLREVAELKARMKSLPTDGISRTIRRHDEFLSALALDVCIYLDSMIEEYDTHPKPTLDFTREMYNRVRTGLELFRRAGLHRNDYLTNAGIDFGLYTAFEQLLLEDLKSNVATTSQINVQPSSESLNQELQTAPPKAEYSDAGFYKTSLKQKYTQAERPKKKKEAALVVHRREVDPVLEQQVVEAWKARGQKRPELANHTYEATKWYRSSHRGNRRDDFAILVIMDHMAARYGYPSVIGK